jgi:hypothetical protein
MGAQLNIQIITARNRVEVEAKFQAAQERAYWEYGHGGYTGTIAEAHGVEVIAKEFDSHDEAWEYIDEHATKWGPALAVRLKGTDRWLLGGWFSE